MKKMYLWGLFLLMLLCACTAEDIILPESDAESPAQSARVTMQEASERLAQLLPSLTPRTRSTSQGVIGQGIALGKEQQPLTRSEESEAWFYYFPIDGGERFAIMSARADMPALLAVGNERPNWEVPSASVPNPMRWNISAAVRAAEERNQAIIDSVSASIGDIGVVVGPDTMCIVRGTPYEVYAAGVEPTDLCPVKWGQDDPYNNLLPMNPVHPKYHAKTCCLATAVAQLFASEKMRPASYNGFTYDWDLLVSCPNKSDMLCNPAAIEQVSQLMLELGKPGNLNVKYSGYEWTTTASPSNITRTLKNFGVSDPGKEVAYANNLVIEDLKRGYPVVMFGCREITPDDTDDVVGHEWLVNGMLTMCTPVHVYVGKELIETVYEYEYYFDMNWGWDSVGDGYYLETGLNPSRPADFNPNNYPLNLKGWGGNDLNHYKTIQYGVKMKANE